MHKVENESAIPLGASASQREDAEKRDRDAMVRRRVGEYGECTTEREARIKPPRTAVPLAYRRSAAAPRVTIATRLRRGALAPVCRHRRDAARR